MTYIVDAHHHLWNLSAVDYPWLREKGAKRFFGDPSPIQINYGIPEFRADQGSLSVRKSVHVQVGTALGSEVEETLWLDAQAEAYGLPSAIIAFCDLSLPGAQRRLLEQMECSGRLRGFRQIFSRHPTEDASDGSPRLLSNPTVSANLKLLASLGMSFDLQLTPPHMITAAELFGNIDGLQVALCHAGSPWREDSKDFAVWHEGLSTLAQLPLMYCKLSGLGMFDPVWTADTLRPIVTTVLEVFGPERVMWGSNFPVDKLYRSYEDLVATLLSIVPTVMHEQVFRMTAERFYRI